MNTISKKVYQDIGVKWGLIIGLGMGIFTNLFSVINPGLLFNPIFSLSILVINFAAFIILLVMVGKNARAITGSITVNQAFITLFITVLVHVAVTSFLYYGTELVMKEKKEAKMIELKQKMIDDMEEKGIDDEQIEKSIAMMDKFSDKSPLMIVLGVLLRLLVDLAIAYIVASSIKRAPSVEVVQETT